MSSEPTLLEMQQIEKRFPGVHALKAVDFDLHAGEVHVLLGENGAGKSTLMKVLCGTESRDSGQIIIRGEPTDDLTPKQAQELGIGMVFQELSLVPALSVAENILIGRLPRRSFGMIDWSQANDIARENLARLGVTHIDPHTPVRQLNVAEQQLTEIARVLSRDCQILLLDEPTSALSETEVDRLFETIQRLREQAVGIIYISHRLDEVARIGQRVTVMRDGAVVGTMPVEAADRDTVVQLMVGHKPGEQRADAQRRTGPSLLRIENLTVQDHLYQLTLELHQGEILGIFGLMGAGQTELADALFGLLPHESGAIFIDNQPVQIDHPGDAVAAGIGYLTRDRRGSLIPVQPIAPNVTLPLIGGLPLLRSLNLRDERSAANKYIQDLQVRPPDLNRSVRYLSGGNQQKVLLARWMHSGARILIFDEPTRGIDVGAKAEVFALMRRLANDGIGIIMISSEIPEVLSMSDRILVMRDGRFKAEYASEKPTQAELLHSASYATEQVS
ncbi:MAG: sugar ABC transporter ATP-binding protein [Chloroflexi bacterium]|nr:sugar ABC transporter ATP-binding protein [Chloroflexota bacterium]